MEATAIILRVAGRARRVVFLGDFNVDIILDGMEQEPQRDREVSCRSFELAMGASSCIAACAYASLGGESWLCGLAGADYFGDFMLQGLESFGVRTTEVRRRADVQTGVTVNLVQGSARTQVTYPGSIAAFSAADVSDRALEHAAHVHVSGVYQAKALLPGVDAVLRRAHAVGATTSLDCQWDPSERWELLSDWLPHVDWLFANDQEALSITGRTTLEEALSELAGRTRCPVIKQGARGATAVVDGRPLRDAARTVAVVDTIGAGDNFDSGFLFATVERNLTVPAALGFANAVAARSCRFRGGTAARTRWQDIDPRLPDFRKESES